MTPCSGRLLTETNTAGALAGLSVTNFYNELGLRTALGLDGQSSASISYGYDNASRLSTVASGDLTATYSYLANSPLVEQISFQNGGTTRMTTAKQYDYLNRLTGISSTPSASSQIGFSYGYNQANQRTNMTLGPDGSSWVYGYDKLGQVTSGKKYWKDGTPVAGEQFEYTFDDIGNRLRTKTGGDSSGGSLRVAAYTNNLLNQITGRDIPGTNDIIGIAHASATVTVNGTNTYRKGEFYQQALIFTNRAFSLYPYITNTAVMAGVTNSTTGRGFVARSPEVFSYDADGNLTNDGRWVYVWDAENRLTRMVSKTNNPAEACLALDFTYDARGRRISKTVSNWTGSAWSRICQKRFVYDGWNLLAVLDSNGVLAQSFVSGLDLSGSMQGAGGVGGLLAINDASNGVHCVAYDGNGNVMGLVSAADGSVSANYEYGPFGEVLRATGPMAKANPLRFSTKYQDDESDLLYYGYRYHSQTLGRWLSRDPIGEKGTIPVYCFARNAALAHYDFLGLDVGIPTTCAYGCIQVGSLNNTPRDCKFSVTYEFIKGAWNISTHVTSIADIQKDLDKRFKFMKYDPSGECCKGWCIENVTISIHGGNRGQILLSENAEDYYDPSCDPYFTDGVKPIGPNYERAMRARALFLSIRSKMCKNGRIYFTLCDTRTPQLQAALESIFGSDIKVTTYTGRICPGLTPDMPPIIIPPWWPY